MSAETTTLRIGEATTVVVTGTTGPRGPAGADASYSDAVPHALGSASAGVTDAAARADHVHAMPSAADVGADPTGTAASAVSSHAAAVDPHGDRAYADALLAQHIADGTVPTIEYTMTASGVDTYSVTIPNTVRAAVYVPPPHDEWPPGNHDGVVEVEPPADGNTPSWWVVLPTTSPTSFAAAWRDFIDANDHTTVVGAYTDAGALGGVLASQGLYLCHVVPIATPDLLWSGSTPADASTLLDIVAVIAGKEDAGIAQSLIDGLPDVVAGSGIDLTPVGDTLVVSQQGADVQDFSTVGTATWTKPAGATLVMAYVLGGGGGGGAGRKGAEGSARYGGGGGQSGSAVVAVLPASAVSSTVTVTVGDGGAGAAAQTTNSTDGSTGSVGGSSSFGSYAVALGGFGGVGGAATASTTAPQGPSHWPVGTNGLNGDSGSGFGPGSAGHGHAGGGGAGGYRSAANANSVLPGAGGLGAGNLTTPSGSGGAGNNGSTIYGGTGGNGGLASGSGNATSGGAGGAPSGGGGGGGAAANSVGNSGAGGKGGKGFVRVVTLR